VFCWLVGCLATALATLFVSIRINPRRHRYRVGPGIIGNNEAFPLRQLLGVQQLCRTYRFGVELTRCFTVGLFRRVFAEKLAADRYRRLIAGRWFDALLPNEALLDGYQPTMESGDILGHENMGEVIELGSEVTNLKIGDRVVVPFTISCGQCWFCQKGLFSCCDRTNPNAEMAAKAMGQSPAGLFGFSHMLGGYSGGQADYLRVPMADVGSIKVPDSVSDEQALFLSDIFPTGYMAAVNARIEAGDTVAIWGCGPVGQFAIRSALLLGAGRVIAIDEVPERLAMAEAGGAETIDFAKTDVYDELMKRTDKRGPDSCIDAVGCEASGHGSADAVLDKVKAATFLATDRVHVLRQAIMCCRKAGTVSIPGVYVGMGDKIPLGAAMNKGLTIKTGQTHVQAYPSPC
jgi:threonine dehydrogenase-like Zn-dependent dehydrogenase